ncbi:hypothetical protein [Spirosoma radiotolerans]|uniref:Uncharacterized protein n=1 Tax=Spirosoma radiotolerans TaxID=1379870 RepID=A0A0E3ZYS7_9BACT|nr:hypothetical protein [Spirosoma radiotolerans]AKD56990.1 hypothetical protein SD10_20880 [Spirosoma radiotolerans]
MRTFAAIGLLGLLLCHILALLLVGRMIGWQQEGDLASRLRVYRSVDSLVEFYIPLHQQATTTTKLTQPTEGFVYRDTYYEIVRQEIKNDTLLILGYADKKDSFWQQDLLDFIRHQCGNESTSTPLKAHHLLKILLKDYYQGVRLVVNFCPSSWWQLYSIPPFTVHLSTVFLPVHSPPPEI